MTPYRTSIKSKANSNTITPPEYCRETNVGRVRGWRHPNKSPESKICGCILAMLFLHATSTKDKVEPKCAVKNKTIENF